VDTAVKVAGIKANVALLLSNPLTAPFAVIAAAQIPVTLASAAVAGGLIAAQTIPQFDKGTKSLPELSEVAESRPELVKNKGRIELFTTPTILGSDYKGAEVISGANTAKLIDNAVNNDVMGIDLNNRDHQTSQAIKLALQQHDSKFEQHSNKMISELKKNRPANMSALDRMNKTNDYIAKLKNS